MNTDKPIPLVNRLTSWGFRLLAVVSLVLGLTRTYDNYFELPKTSLWTTGIALKTEKRFFFNSLFAINKWEYRGLMAFADQNGKIVVGWSHWEIYNPREPAETAKIIYNKQDPTDFSVQTIFSYWVGPLVLIFFCPLLWLMAGWARSYGLRNRDFTSISKNRRR